MISYMEADRTRLSDIEAQIRDLERSLSALRAEKKVVQKRLSSYKYPVLTIPNEIVSEILVHFLPVYPLCPRIVGPFSPTSLTHICRKWREIALATPALWRAIRLAYEPIPFERQGQIFDIWMRRSGSCPFSIHVDGPLREIFTAFVAHRARCEHLKLRLDYAIDGFMPLLRHVDLLPSGLYTLPVTFQEVPLLRTVVLTGVIISRITMPWEQLTSLTLKLIQPRECIPILRQATNLVDCNLYFWTEQIVEHSGPDVTLPRLTSLLLKKKSYGPLVTGLLHTFIAPALRSLQFPEDFLGSTPIDSLKSFISKSGCKLEEVHVTGVSGDSEVNSFREAFPSIPNFFVTKSFLYDTTDSDESSNSDSSDVESNSDSE